MKNSDSMTALQNTDFVGSCRILSEYFDGKPHEASMARPGACPKYPCDGILSSSRGSGGVITCHHPKFRKVIITQKPLGNPWNVFCC